MWENELISAWMFSLQIPCCCISSANLVVWGGWGNQLLFPSWYVQPFLPAPCRPTLQATWPSDMQLWACTWVGYKACEVSVVNVKWPACSIPLLFRWAWELDPLPCRRFCCRELQHANQSQVLDDTNWLYTYKRWSLCRLCFDISQGTSAGKDFYHPHVTM